VRYTGDFVDELDKRGTGVRLHNFTKCKTKTEEEDVKL
jgi:hypothetical protein